MGTTRTWAIGFEDDGLGLLNTTQLASVVSTAGTDFDGNYCLSLPDYTSYALKLFPTARDDYYFSFLAKLTHEVSSHQNLFNIPFTSGVGTYILYAEVLWGASTGTIKVYLEGVLIATGTLAIPAAEVLRFECYVKIAGSGGRVVIKVNSWHDNNATWDNVADINYTGDTDPGTGSPELSQVLFGYSAECPLNLGIFLDNIIFDTGEEIGNTHICALVPTGAGSNTDWTPSVGNNWDCVEEIPQSLVDFVYTNVSANVDTHATSDLSTSGTIKCVMGQATIAKEGTPTPNTIYVVIKTEGSISLANPFTPTTTPTVVGKCFPVNPTPSAAWTESQVNAMEIGYEAVTV